MAWTSSALLIRCFIFSVAHRFIAGSTQANEESIATWYPRTTAPTSSHFYKHFVGKMTHRILFCLLQSRPHPLLARMACHCQMSPDLRTFSITSVRSESIPPLLDSLLSDNVTQRLWTT